MPRDAARRALVVLIVAAAAALVVGVALERQARTHEAQRTSGEAAPVRHAAQSGVFGSEAGETGQNNESGTVSGAPPHGERVREESSERLLGVDPESTGVLALAVVVSLLLAGAVWLAAAPWLLVVVAVVMAAFAALDVREVVHQIGESRTGLALLAALVAALHVAAALVAARAAASGRRAGARPAAAT